MKKLKPGIYSHRVSGQQAIVGESGYSHTYAAGTIPEPNDEDRDVHGSARLPGFPIAYGTLEDNPEIWEWVCEL